MRSLSLAALVLLAGGMTGRGQEPNPPPEPTRLPDGLAPTRWQRVIEVIDGDTVVLDDGQQLRLVGIQAPKLPLGRRNFTAWPLAREAKAALEALTLGHAVGLVVSGDGTRDRHGRLLAHLATPEGLWIQGRLLELGLARVYSFADNRVAVSELLALERQARTSGRGIWGHPFYRVRDAADAAALWTQIDSFQVLEGKILGVHEGRRATYLNFGEDWRQDFTLRIESADRRAFRDAGLELAGLTGKRVRVRGWLGAYNGPSMDITHPEQLEVLEP